MQEEIEFIRLVFISPHDDAVVGAALLIQLAKRENVPVHILIVTDGSMGYCSAQEKDTIADMCPTVTR